jgi:hypothetical protein
VRVVENDRPVSNALIQLFKEDVVWKSGISNSFGSVYFYVKWVDFSKSDDYVLPEGTPLNNITESLVLKVNGNSISKLSLNSNSPIIINSIISDQNEFEPLLGLFFTVSLFGMLFFVSQVIDDY